MVRFLSDTVVGLLRPSAFAPGANMLRVDELVATSLRQDLTVVEALIKDPYYLDRLVSSIFYRLPHLNSLRRDRR